MAGRYGRFFCQRHVWFDFPQGCVSQCDYGPFVTFRTFPVGERPRYSVGRLSASHWRLLTLQQQEEYAMGLLEKPSGDGGKGKPKKANVDQDFAKKYPWVWEYLSASAYKTGEARQTATLTLFCDGGVWSCALTDREEDRTCWCSGLTLEALLQALEERVSEPGSWRQRKGGGKGGKRS